MSIRGVDGAVELDEASTAFSSGGKGDSLPFAVFFRAIRARRRRRRRL